MSSYEPDNPDQPIRPDDVDIDPALLPDPAEPAEGGDEDIETWEDPPGQ